MTPRYFVRYYKMQNYIATKYYPESFSSNDTYCSKILISIKDNVRSLSTCNVKIETKKST